MPLEGRPAPARRLKTTSDFRPAFRGRNWRVVATSRRSSSGVRFAISRDVVSTAQADGLHRLILAGGAAVCARSVVIASGARYSQLNVKNHEDFENRGFYYAATAMESIYYAANETSSW